MLYLKTWLCKILGHKWLYEGNYLFRDCIRCKHHEERYPHWRKRS